MFRHVVMFRWKPETTPDDVTVIAEALGGLPAVIPELKEYRFGSDAGIGAGNFDFVVTADFDSADDYLVYRDNPQHRAIADNELIPRAAERAAVQFES